jgi:hypothetical protein
VVLIFILGGGWRDVVRAWVGGCDSPTLPLSVSNVFQSFVPYSNRYEYKFVQYNITFSLFGGKNYIGNTMSSRLYRKIATTAMTAAAMTAAAMIHDY